MGKPMRGLTGLDHLVTLLESLEVDDRITIIRCEDNVWQIEAALIDRRVVYAGAADEYLNAAARKVHDRIVERKG